MMNGFDKMLAGSLQLEEPWYVEGAEFDSEKSEFEGYAMLIMADVPRAKASRLLRCDEKSLASILSFWVHDAVEKTSLSDVRSIAIDETSFKRGHNYVTVAIDAVKRRVFDVEKGRDKAAVKAVADMLSKHEGSPANITSATSDMSASYLPAVKENFLNAMQIIHSHESQRGDIELFHEPLNERHFRGN